MPDILPTINNEPAQGIQALLDTVYLWNPDVANGLIDKVNELLEELGELSNISGAIKPYSQLEAPVRQYMPMSYNDGVYVANEEMTTLPATPDLSKWTLIATKVDEQAIEAVVANEAEARAAADSALQGAIREETLARQAADSNLQTQIDAISAASDVTDIVGTHAELENYDTSTLSDNDIIKVLRDETQEDATTYYRWVAAEDEFQLIGEEGPYYTKAQTDTLLEAKQDIMQFETMPEADASNANKVIQYVGEDIPESRASAVATQTVGSGLTDLSVNVDTFIEAEQPSGSETVSFIANVTDSSVVFNVVTGDFTVSIPYWGLRQLFIDNKQPWDNNPEYWNGTFTFYNADQCGFGPEAGSDWVFIENIAATAPNYGLVITGAPSGSVEYDYATYSASAGSTSWSKNGTTVDPTDYGISYNGTPANGDAISVAYTPEEKGVARGYFYVNQPTYTDPSATISQTVGSGLTDLSIDVDTFIEAEQPSGSETVGFVATMGNKEFVGDTTQYVGPGRDVAITITNPGLFIEKAKAAWDEQFGEQQGYFEDVVDGVNISVAYNEDLGTNAVYEISCWIGASDYAITQVDPDVSEWYIQVSPTPALDSIWGSRFDLGRNVIWSKNGTTVDLATYGVSYGGTPANGDTLTVAYTAASVSSYAWEQINVQPGGAEGINWVGQWDKPADMQNYYYHPCYDFAVLPVGTYEVYFQNRQLIEYTEGRAVWGQHTFKVTFDIVSREGISTQAFGVVSWVLDGSTDFSRTNLSSTGIFPLSTDGAKNRLVGWSESTAALIGNGDLNQLPVEGLFRWTNIKNVATGEEYPITVDDVYGYSSGNLPYWCGEFGTGTAVNDPFVPEFVSTWSGNVNDFETNTVFFERYAALGLLHLIHKPSSSEFVVNLRGGTNDASTLTPYSQEIVKATGIFSGCYLAYNNDYTYLAGVDTATAATLTGTVDVMYGAIKSGSASLWFEPIAENITPVDQAGPTGYRLGTITAGALGNIIQYTGPTDANYTNGYFYKAMGTAVVVPGSFVFSDYTVSGVTVSVTDVDAFVAQIAEIQGWSTQDVEINFENNSNWYLAYSETDGLVYADFNWFSTRDQAVLQYIAVTWDRGGDISCVATYTPGRTDIQNGHWERIDVQPAPESLPDQTGNAGKFLTTDGTGASWSDVTTTKDCYNEGRLHIGGNNSASLYITQNTTSTSSFTGGYIQPNSVFGGLQLAAVSGAVYQGRIYGFSRTALIPNYLGSSGVLDLGSGEYMWKTVYATKINNGADISIPTTGGIMAVQVSTLPTAGSALEGQIYQFVGATDSTYTNGHFYKCVSDGADPAAYSWEEVSLGGGSSYTAGTGIDITSGVISVTAPTLTNANSTNDSIIITDQNPNTYNVGSDVVIGKSITFGSVGSSASVAIGKETSVGQSTVAIGYQAKVYGTSKTGIISIGYKSNALGNHCIQLNASGNSATNPDDNTFKVANANGNYEIMSADGTVPTARLTKVNTTITLTAAGWSNSSQTVNVTGMTADGVVFVSPTPANQSAYTSAGILCTAQAAGSLTFTCDTVPSADITVTIVML